MQHYTAFTKYELSNIRRLLDEKIGKPRCEQLRISNELRNIWGFYVTEFCRNCPYTSQRLDMDIEDGTIEVIQMTPEENYTTGWPQDLLTGFKQKASQYLRYYHNMKVGITSNPSKRLYQHLHKNPEMHWERMIVIYKTDSVEHANFVEDAMMNYYKDSFVNVWTGKSWMTEEGPYYAYLLLGEHK